MVEQRSERRLKEERQPRLNVCFGEQPHRANIEDDAAPQRKYDELDENESGDLKIR